MKFPTTVAHKLSKQIEATRWLIEGLWAAEAVGIIGGEPKSYKSFLALHMAVSVASGKPCLGRYKVPEPGRALVFCGEDSLPNVRKRLEAIAIAAGIPFSKLDVHVITAPSFRIDLEKDQQMLHDTMAALKPKLLVLDPFVRLHRVDENKSGEIAPLLSYLRELQRVHNASVALVHHAKKGGKKMRGGQSLRGSSEFHAWGDSNLYPRRLHRHEEDIELEVEHRDGAAIHGLILRPVPTGESIALTVIQEAETQEPANHSSVNVKDQVVSLLQASDGPLSRNVLRELCRVRTATMIGVLAELVEEKRVRKHGRGYTVPVPSDP